MAIPTTLHFLKRLNVLETCKPMFAPDPRPQALQCAHANKPTTERELHKFEQLCAKELLNYLDNSPLVGLYHQNSLTGRDKSSTFKHLNRNNMRMGFYNRYLVKRTLTGTKYEAILPLFNSHTRFVFCKEPVLNVLLKLQKKMPTFLLLAGIIDNRLMSKKDLEWYGSLPSLELLHGQLYGTLNALSTQMIQNLSHHQMQLSHSLSLLAKPEDNEKSTETPNPTDS